MQLTMYDGSKGYLVYSSDKSINFYYKEWSFTLLPQSNIS
jgi:hypothetical protein